VDTWIASYSILQKGLVHSSPRLSFLNVRSGAIPILQLQHPQEKYRKAQLIDLWGKLVKLTEKSQFLLVNIGQTFKNVIALQEVIRKDNEN
jgi:hypothetical protein